MMPVQGCVLRGLDEFMLRLGHLSVLCAVARDTGNGWTRLQRGLSEFVANPVSVDAFDTHLIMYLASRRLCQDRRRDASPPSATREQLRYPDLEISDAPDGRSYVKSLEGSAPSVWYQDWHLSRPSVKSRVGAVTVSGKSGSKTGVSHILDWGETLGLFSSGGQLLPLGDLLGAIAERSPNPYVLGAERILFGAVFLRGDIDFSSRFLTRLQAMNGAIDKTGARNAFLEAVREAADDADKQSGVRARDRFVVFGQLKELERSARGSGEGETKASTAWHRTVSRLEAYVDIGLLDKAAGSDAGAFEYRYKSTAALGAFCRAVQSCGSIREFLRDHLITLFYPEVRSNTKPDARDLLRALASVVEMVKRPIASHPMEAVVLGIGTWLAERSAPVTLGHVEDAVVELAKQRPDVLRLGSGTEGAIPETVSINRAALRGLSE